LRAGSRGIYRQFGFQETGRMKFNPEFAHNWDASKGAPDVVFMAWKGYPRKPPWRAPRAATTGLPMSDQTDKRATGTQPRLTAELSPEEREIIDWLERSRGRKLTPEEINLSLDQARLIGEL
jgi:hypothetical protein